MTTASTKDIPCICELAVRVIVAEATCTGRPADFGSESACCIQDTVSEFLLRTALQHFDQDRSTPG